MHFYYSHVPPANYQKYLYHSLQTTSSSFPPWSCRKVEMPDLWQCNHFHGNRLWPRKNKMMMTSRQDLAEGEAGFHAGVAPLQTQIALMTAGETWEITAGAGRDPQACHTNVSISHAHFGRSESTIWCFWKQMCSHWDLGGCWKV